jgi:hypothetical protein
MNKYDFTLYRYDIYFSRTSFLYPSKAKSDAINNFKVFEQRSVENPKLHDEIVKEQIQIVQLLLKAEMLAKLSSDNGVFPFHTDPIDYPTVDDLAKAIRASRKRVVDNLKHLHRSNVVTFYDEHRLKHSFFFKDQENQKISEFASLTYGVRDIFAEMEKTSRNELIETIIRDFKVIVPDYE